MKSKALFGVQFSEKKHYKTLLLESYERWKLEKQWFLAKEQNEYEVVKRLVQKHSTEQPNDKRSEEEIAAALWQDLRREIHEKGWQKIYDEILGNDQVAPDRNGGPTVYRREVKALFEEDDCRQYYFTDPALKECEKLEVKNPLNLDRLRPTADGKRQLNFGNQFIRYEKRDQKIVALSAAFTPRQEASFLQHTFFHFDLDQKIESPKLRYDHVALLLKTKTHTDLGDSPVDFDKLSHLLLYKMIFFLDLAEAEQIFLPAGGRNGTRISSTHLRNQETYPITIVTSNWNRSIRIDPIPVIKHYKQQPYGPGSQWRKKIEIQPYTRNGYTIKAQKVLATA